MISDELVRVFDAAKRYGLYADVGRRVGASGQAVKEWATGVTVPSEQYWSALEEYFKMKEGSLANLATGPSVSAAARPASTPTPPAVAGPSMDGATMLAVVRQLDAVVRRLEALADQQERQAESPAPRARRQPAATSRRKGSS